jgi:hypothetical protein
MKTVARFAHPPEAYLLQTLLASEDIEAEVFGAESMGYLAGGSSLNAVRVEVRDEDFGRAREMFLEWQGSRVEAAAQAEKADENLTLPTSAVALRGLILVYLLALVPLGLFNREALEASTYDQVRYLDGPGAAPEAPAWSLSYHGYPGYFICSIISSSMIYFHSRWGRPLFLGTLGWWVLASVFAVGGRRAVVSWPAEIICFALGVTIGFLMYRPPFDSIFYPDIRRGWAGKSEAQPEAGTER